MFCMLHCSYLRCIFTLSSCYRILSVMFGTLAEHPLHAIYVSLAVFVMQVHESLIVFGGEATQVLIQRHFSDVYSAIIFSFF